MFCRLARLQDAGYNEYMLGFIAAIIFLLPTYLIRFDIYGIPSTLLELLIYASVLWLIISQPIMLTLERLKPIVRRYGLPILLILIGASIGLLTAVDTRSALGLLKAYILDPILFFIVIVASQNLPEEQRKADLYQAALIALGVSLALSALFIPTAYTPDGRALGVYVLDHMSSPNFLALILSPIAVFSLSAALFEKSKTIKLWGTIGFIAAAAGLLATASRGGLLAVGLTSAIAVGMYLYQKVAINLKKILLGAGALMVIIALGLTAWIARPDFSDGASERAATSNNIRYEIWRTTVVDLVPQHWLVGTGLGSYQEVFTKETADRVNFPEFIAPWALTPHNIFLTWWMNVGLFGLIGFVWLLVLHLQNLRRADKPLRPLAYALGFAMLAVLLHGMVDAAYWKNDLAVLFWLLIGLGQVTQRLEGDDVTT